MPVSFLLRSPLEAGGELGIIAEGDMHNSAQADGRERLTALKAVEARLRRLGGLAFAADSKDRIADGNLIDLIPAPFPFWTSHLRILSLPNVSVLRTAHFVRRTEQRLVGAIVHSVAA